jgi:hypothetical protein
VFWVSGVGRPIEWASVELFSGGVTVDLEVVESVVVLCLIVGGGPWGRCGGGWCRGWEC